MYNCDRVGQRLVLQMTMDFPAFDNVVVDSFDEYLTEELAEEGEIQVKCVIRMIQGTSTVRDHHSGKSWSERIIIINMSFL